MSRPSRALRPFAAPLAALALLTLTVDETSAGPSGEPAPAGKNPALATTGQSATAPVATAQAAAPPGQPGKGQPGKGQSGKEQPKNGQPGKAQPAAGQPGPSPRKGPDPARQPAADAHTRFVLAGGGAAPFNTQVSLEEHLLRFQHLLETRSVPSDRRPLLFAGGNNSDPVVEIFDPTTNQASLLNDLALVFGRTDNRGVTWRPTKLTDISGPSTEERLKAALTATNGRSRTLFYFAGHGFQDEESKEVTMGLWGDERLTPVDLSRWLDPLPANHRVVTVLAQCHAGGFGNFIYQDADPAQGISRHDRCGFFAAPADYPAAGCTPEANRVDPDDYSTWFLSALSGQLPGGKPLPSEPDLDGDGRVSLAEANAFARIHDGTIDVPISSAEVYLRNETQDLEPYDGLTLSSPFPAIVKAARPPERAVLEALAATLKLSGDPAAALKARFEADRLTSERARLLTRIDTLSDQREDAREALQRALTNRWPWLGNPYHLHGSEVRKRDGEAIHQLISRSPERTALNQADKALGDVDAQVGRIEDRWATWERLARAAETVVLEAQLRARGTQAQVRKLDEILRCEGDSL